MAQRPVSRKEYLEKVYAGVLGKMIGVYLGRPVEGWTYDQILSQVGEIRGYVNEKLGVPLVVTDDDLSGTFTFVRAVEDFGDREVTAAEIGETWLNYLIEHKTILWWGGRGTSTEHTAYLNLASGIPAPASGSAAVNGGATANQIGAMIFIDGWAMLCPGDADKAARFARAAASVSHDQDAVEAAVVIAVMEALAFHEPDLEVLLTAAEAHVNPTGLIARQIEAVRALHRREPDWKKARHWLEQNHGYDRYPGTCHAVPNFSLIVLALLYGQGDFRQSLTIVTTAGWDTDCNAANLGCLLGIRGGLAPIQACADLREPPRDQLYLVSADGGRALTDAAREALALANLHFRLAGEPEEVPKAGARFSFPFMGAVHGFQPAVGSDVSQAVRLHNVQEGDGRALLIAFEAPRLPVVVATPTFVPPASRQQPTYEFLACPTLYPGQTVTAEVAAGPWNAVPVEVGLQVLACGPNDAPVRHRGPGTLLQAGQTARLSWVVDPHLDGPILDVGLHLASQSDQTQSVVLKWLTWDGVPSVVWNRGRPGTQEWKRTWVSSVSHWWTQFPDVFHLSQDRGTGLLLQGQRGWADYEVTASIAGSGARQFGLAARVQGLQRYYALLVGADHLVRLVRRRHGVTILAEQAFEVVENRKHTFRLGVQGARLTAWIDQHQVFSVLDDGPDRLASGAVALVIEEGTLRCNEVHLRALPPAEGGPPSTKPA